MVSIGPKAWVKARAGCDLSPPHMLSRATIFRTNLLELVPFLQAQGKSCLRDRLPEKPVESGAGPIRSTPHMPPTRAVPEAVTAGPDVRGGNDCKCPTGQGEVNVGKECHRIASRAGTVGAGETQLLLASTKTNQLRRQVLLVINLRLLRNDFH